jgi:hypothetical protein
MIGLSQSYSIKKALKKIKCSVCSQYFDSTDLILYLPDNGLKSKEVYTLSDLKLMCKSCSRDRSLDKLLNTEKCA